MTIEPGGKLSNHNFALQSKQKEAALLSGGINGGSLQFLPNNNSGLHLYTTLNFSAQDTHPPMSCLTAFFKLGCFSGIIFGIVALTWAIYAGYSKKESLAISLVIGGISSLLMTFLAYFGTKCTSRRSVEESALTPLLP